MDFFVADSNIISESKNFNRNYSFKKIYMYVYIPNLCLTKLFINDPLNYVCNDDILLSLVPKKCLRGLPSIQKDA